MNEFKEIEENTEEEIQERNPYTRIIYGGIALLILLGFIYSSGISQYLFYRRTPTSLQQTPLTTVVADVRELTIPLKIFVLRNEEFNGSKRTHEEVINLVENADAIWEQGNVTLQIKGIIELEKKDEEIDLLFDDTSTFLGNIDELSSQYINVFLTGNLRGINGIAFTGLSTVAVADYTSVPDFRALAHEVGHILGLRHVSDQQYLMYQGADGFMLSLEEISRARGQAETIYQQ